MLLESLFMKLGQMFLSISSWFMLIQSRALSKASMIGMKTNDIFLLIPMLIGVVAIAVLDVCWLLHVLDLCWLS
jgi:hypothetical protein